MITEKHHLYHITDREIYDFIVSSKQRITNGVMLELARDRGIFYSSKDSRLELASKLASLHHDYYDLQIFTENGQHSSRGERVTTVELPSSFDDKIIEKILNAYRDTTQTENAVVKKDSEGYLSIKYEYSEWDYGKNPLNQRRPKDGQIEIVQSQGKTTFRMPSTERANEIVEKIVKSLEAEVGKKFDLDKISLEKISDPALRTQFFTNLIKSLPGLKYQNVTRVRVEADQSKRHDTENSELDLDLSAEIERAEEEMLSAVNRISLNGNGLLSSDEFKQLTVNGFYISSIIWISKHNKTKSKIEIEAGFDDAINGKGFRYSIRGYQPLLKKSDEDYAKTMRGMPQEEKKEIYPIIEKAAKAAIDKIIKESQGRKKR